MRQAGPARDPDAKAIEDELKNYYGFETRLAVADPSKAEIVAALKTYKNEITYGEDDQLFIFIAGHGTFIEDFREGYLIVRNSLKEILMPRLTSRTHSCGTSSTRFPANTSSW